MPVLEVPESETLEHIDDTEGHVWQVILYNDDYHLFDQVVAQVQKATGYAYPRALRHHDGGAHDRTRGRLVRRD
jgi:ATP-dependent Clp protease adapter protein ClpS